MNNTNGIIHSNGIIKSINDDKTYYPLTLENGLRTLLIHDPHITKSSAALSVNVGSLQDGDVDGIAHYLEHMLFMGSEKYPDQNLYSATLAKYNGSSNAFTSDTNTCYFFDVNTAYFEQILDIFAQFFIAPKFAKESLMLEMNAVNSEHQNNVLNDNWRLFQLMKTIGKKNHPFNKFNTGSLETLNIPNIETKVREFYNKYYTSARYFLCIISSLPIEEQKLIVEKQFANVPNKPIETLHPIQTQFELPYETPILLKVAPIKTKNMIKINWQLNFMDEIDKYKDYAIMGLISHLIGYEGEGSLFELLRSENLAYSLSAGINGQIGNIVIYSVTIETPPNVDRQLIISLVYKYISLLFDPKNRDKLIEQYVEIQKLSRETFINCERADCASSAINIVQTFWNINCDIEKINSVYRLFENWSPIVFEYIERIIKCFTVENSVVIFMSKDYEGLMDNKEKWYGTEYTIENNVTLQDGSLNTPNISLSASAKQFVDNINEDKLHIPYPNRYIGEYGTIDTTIINDKIPRLVACNNNVELWHQYTTEWKIPYTGIFIDFEFDNMVNTIKDYVQYQVFVISLLDMMNPQLYECQMSHSRLGIYNDSDKLNVEIYGKTSIVYNLVELVVNTLMNPNINEKCYKRTIDRLIETYRNALLNQPYKLASMVIAEKIETFTYNIVDLLDTMNKITFDDIKNYSNKIKNSYIRCYSCGTLKESELLKIADMLSVFQPSKLPGTILNTVEVSNGIHIFDTKPYNSLEVNSACLVHYGITYIDSEDENINKLRCLTSLMVSFLADNFFDQLRTKEQLGYISQCYRSSFGPGKLKYMTIAFIVQSNVKDQYYLSERIQKFVKDMQENINGITTEEFNDHKVSLIHELQKPVNNIHEQMNENYRKMVYEKRVMNHKQILINILNTLELNDLKEFYDKYLVNAQTVWVSRVGIH